MHPQSLDWNQFSVLILRLTILRLLRQCPYLLLSTTAVNIESRCISTTQHVTLRRF